MLLILTNSQDATADYLIPILSDSGTPFLRLDTDTLVAGSSVSYTPDKPVFRISDTVVTSDQIRHVWYRRPEQLIDDRFGDAAEGKFALNEWSEAVEGFLAHVPKKRWMNHPSANASASNKLEQLTTARSLGFSIPDTLLTQDAEEARKFYKRYDGRVVVKPMSNGYVEREHGKDSLIYTNRVADPDLDSMGDLSHCPTLFQQFVVKSSDVRITVVDHSIHAVELHAKDAEGQQRCDIRRNNMSDVEYSHSELPERVTRMIRNLMAHYELRFAAIDMVVDLDDKWHFLEVNPNGQWAWLDIARASNIAHSFVEAFTDG